MTNHFYKLTLITNKGDIPLYDYLTFIETCAKSGITSLQLREKNTFYEDLLEFGRNIKKILAPHNIPFIINDDLDLAIELNADGIHLGQTDGDPIAARKHLGPDKVIGVSINSLKNLHDSNELPINYVGIGAIFPTDNKPNITTIWGIEGLKNLASLSKHPIVAIGGINEANAPEVISGGAHGIAVIGALHDAIDPALATKSLRQIIDMRSQSHA